MSANIERTAEHTKPTPLQVAIALVLAWRKLWGSTPSLATVFLLVAQWALETGWGAQCFCWNLGNAKWASGYDWCVFACGEELPLASALKYQSEDPDHVHIVQRYTKKGQAWASCKFLPPHPMCRFKAFATIDEAAIYYLSDLRRRFALAWPAVLAGDPAQFSQKLSIQHYFTAPEAQYEGTMLRTFHGMPGHLPGFDPAKVEAPAPPPEGITDEDRERVDQLVSLTVEQMVNELGHDGAPPDEAPETPRNA